MDPVVNYKKEEFARALASLDEVLRAERNDITRDSAIKRFEFTFESAWKTIKAFLREKFGVDAFAPKDCFRELLRNGLISEAETEELLLMTDDRNRIVHTYSEAFSDELFQKVVASYAQLLRMIFQKIEK